MFKQWRHLFYREYLLAIRSPSEWLHPLLFFVVVVSLFPLAISPDPHLLTQIGPGIIWMATLFAAILSFSHLFLSDYQDGSLEQLILNIRPLSLVVLTKVGMHALLLGLPLIVLSPFLAVAYDLSPLAVINLVLSLLLGVPSLCLLGSMAASITLSLRNSSLLLALILLPLYVPILIFSSSAVMRAQLGQPAAAEFSMLAALFIFLIMLAPWVSSYCLKVAVEA